MATKLLLADDSATIQRVIGLTFAGLDVEVIVAGDGDEAIARIAVDRPDIVLADIGMPKRSGYEVSAFVKSHPGLGRVPVVLLAGAFEPIDDARARAARCDGVLVKPLEPQQVIATVHDLIERANAASRAVPRDVSGRPPDVFDDGGVVDSALDDYLDRVDQRFSRSGLSDVARAHGVEAGSIKAESRLVVPEYTPSESGTAVSGPLLDDLLSSTPFEDVGLLAAPIPAAAPPALRTVPPTNGHDVSAEPDWGAVESSKRSVVAQAFSAILAAESGERPAAAPLPLRPIGAPGITDAMVDDLARRVLERLSDGSSQHVNGIVRRMVSDVAERLVREEIGRLLH